MKILMTGGTGLLGNALGQELVRRGHEVVILARDAEGARERLSYPCEIYPWPNKGELPENAFQGVKALVHLAGENIAGQRWSSARKAELRASRLSTADQLARACAKGGLSVVVSASAIGFYGERGDEELSESSAAGEGFLSELCRDWEAKVLSIPAQRHVIQRLGVILSSRGGFLREVVPMFRMLGASRLGSGRQHFSWIHVDDAVHMFVRSLEDQSIRGVYNAVSPQSVTNSELTTILSEALRAFRAPPVPAFGLKLIYGELSQALLGSQKVIPQAWQAVGFSFKFASLRGALADIYPDMRPGEMKSVFEQWVPAELGAVWDFFSSETNLETITPPLLQFHVLGKDTAQIQKGTLIDYRLKIRGVPVRWRTRITEWTPKTRFADEQLKGPYTRWYHVHEFEKLRDGILMRDTVHWIVPMGALGRLVSLKLVLKDVTSIFAYRAKVIAATFFR